MSWSASITDIQKESGSIRVYVNFTNGSEKLRREYLIDHASKNRDWLVEQIKNVVANLENIASFGSDIQLGPVALDK